MNWFWAGWPGLNTSTSRESSIQHVQTSQQASKQTGTIGYFPRVKKHSPLSNAEVYLYASHTCVQGKGITLMFYILKIQQMPNFLPMAIFMLQSSGSWCCAVMSYTTNISEDHGGTIFRVKMETAWHHNPKDHDLNLHHRENPKSCINNFIL